MFQLQEHILSMLLIENLENTEYMSLNQIYVPSLISWTELVALVLNKYPATPDSNLDNGTEVKIYIRSGSTRSECLSAEYTLSGSSSTINDAFAATTAQSVTVDLSSFSGKWLQYKVELITASKNISPELLSALITYKFIVRKLFLHKNV